MEENFTPEEKRMLEELTPFEKRILMHCYLRVGIAIIAFLIIITIVLAIFANSTESLN